MSAVSIEINHLKKRAQDGQLGFVDISLPDFSTRYPELDLDELNRRIHGLTETGEWLVGLDVTHKAWSLVGKSWLYAPLRWPGIKWFADKFYLWFAKHRHEIAYLVTRKERCDTQCSNKLK